MNRHCGVLNRGRAQTPPVRRHRLAPFTAASPVVVAFYANVLGTPTVQWVPSLARRTPLTTK
ncbi:uncharacterized protein LY79DRAFT_389051 [Colletotrichum navitas]|uniref:Uncharacterized protein n=1 Tax=Colletotrichum navitas TaxID=681940 RepID=A0AAD8QAL5_9PEZI|nr:uncharacterized protein LY79DRAFT_389051 [Colletotrichum navitas]KAK1597524.1 hypothetical protein LY79DRAFT_389051 [Colletotrichum navitas]